jgi:hypothetical protein
MGMVYNGLRRPSPKPFDQWIVQAQIATIHSLVMEVESIISPVKQVD